MTVFIIPTQPSQNQKFKVGLASAIYIFELQFINCDENPFWVLNISDINSVPIISGIALVTGEDLLHQFQHLDFGGKLYVVSAPDPSVTPLWDTLGATSQLVFESDD